MVKKIGIKFLIIPAKNRGSFLFSPYFQLVGRMFLIKPVSYNSYCVYGDISMKKADTLLSVVKHSVNLFGKSDGGWGGGSKISKN